MGNSETHNPRFPDLDEPTDMEIAIRISRMLEDCWDSAGESDSSGWKKSLISMANNVLNTMTNPFARKLLADQIGR
jgi:hypothetical protein